MNKLEEVIRHQPVLCALFVGREGKIVVAQNPNLPLYGFLVLKAVSLLTRGRVSHYASDGAAIGIVIWAVFELISGVNLFRRLIGGGVLIFLAISQFVLPGA